jgi:predicted DNA-binding transcriptional regulator YafY
MPRNQEVIRQWQILRTIEASRLGVSLADLAAATGVTTRTIRRDLDALQEVGFPLYADERDEGRFWRLNGRALRGLEREGFTLSEAGALYFSRSMLETLAGAPLRDDVAHAFDKVAAALPPAMRRFLDRLPAVVAVKAEPVQRKPSRAHGDLLARLLDASVQHRRVRMRYHSVSSNRTKEYVVEPHQVAYGQGALYLLAFVPEYREVRTFAIDRVERLTVLEETFEPVQDVTREVFPNSLGVHQGPATRVVLVFDARVAPYVQDRTWHPSQQTESRSDGSVVLTLDVCDDWALRTWVLSFGSLVRVVQPRSLAEHVLTELEGARQQYAPRIEFEVPRVVFDSRRQRLLPFHRAGVRTGPGARTRRIERAGPDR